jgi:hypothetical protein
MTVHALTEKAVKHVLENMRASNAREIFATRDDEPDAAGVASLRKQLEAMHPLFLEGWSFPGKDGQAAAFLMAFRKSPGVAQIFMVATDLWPDVARTVFRFCKDVLYRRGLTGIHRCETRVLEGSDHRWLLRLGYQVEGIDRHAGKNGENFVRLAWIKPGAFDDVRT